MITENAKINSQSKTVFEYKQEGKVIMKDEVEEAILKKYENNNNQRQEFVKDAKVAQLSRQAIVDTKLVSSNYHTSHATEKRMFTANKNSGYFEKSDMLAWFRNVNNTKILPTKIFLKQAKSDHAKLTHLGNYMEEVNSAKIKAKQAQDFDL
jgi:hypothetical protein